MSETRPPSIETEQMPALVEFDHLVEQVLQDNDSRLEPLIELAGGQETEWLEFKAAMPTSGDGLNAQDYAWHVVKALVALTNTGGGAVLLGVDDAGTAVGLEPSDPKNFLDGGFDSFARNVIRARITDRREWKGANAHHRLGQGERLIDVRIRRGSHQGKTVAVLVVGPRAAGGDLLLVERLRPTPKELCLVRSLGDVGGDVELVTTPQRRAWRVTRLGSARRSRGLYDAYLSQRQALLLDLDAIEADVRGPTLVVRHASGSITVHELPRETVILGRGESADIQIPHDPGVSRAHLSFALQPPTLTVTAFGADPGTLIDDVTLPVGEPRAVRNRSRLTLGSTVIHILSPERTPRFRTWKAVLRAREGGQRDTTIGRESLSPGRSAPERWAPLHLVVVEGPASVGESITIDSARAVFIGRDETCEFHLDDKSISRRHASLSRTPDGRLRLLDLQSTNGVFVNGEMVKVTTLEGGETIWLGDCVLECRVPPAEVAAAVDPQPDWILPPALLGSDGFYDAALLGELDVEPIRTRGQPVSIAALALGQERDPDQEGRRRHIWAEFEVAVLEALPAGDVAMRRGPECVVLLLAGARRLHARLLAARLVQRATESIASLGGVSDLTMSGGVAELGANEEIGAALARALVALDTARSAGGGGTASAPRRIRPRSPGQQV